MLQHCIKKQSINKFIQVNKQFFFCFVKVSHTIIEVRGDAAPQTERNGYRCHVMFEWVMHVNVKSVPSFLPGIHPHFAKERKETKIYPQTSLALPSSCFTVIAMSRKTPICFSGSKVPCSVPDSIVPLQDKSSGSSFLQVESLDCCSIYSFDIRLLFIRFMENDAHRKNKNKTKHSCDGLE